MAKQIQKKIFFDKLSLKKKILGTLYESITDHLIFLPLY